jgi:hypothetical protein
MMIVMIFESHQTHMFCVYSVMTGIDLDGRLDAQAQHEARMESGRSQLDQWQAREVSQFTLGNEY